MELGGDEKRIRALFSELAFRDQSYAPRFERLWGQAEKAGPLPVRNFRRPVVLMPVAALTIIAACALAAWFWFTTTQTPTHDAINVVPLITAPSPAVHDAYNASSPEPRRLHHRRKKRPETYRSTESAMTEAALLSRWQSPTKSFMESPTAVDLSSLPQLNQSAEDLKQFLPKNTEAIKESNQ